MTEQSGTPTDSSPAADQHLMGAQAWTRYLADRDLPTRHSSLARLTRETASPRSTLMSITAIIKSDPVLCLQVIREAQTLHSSKGSDVTGIDHAIGSLGMERLRKLAGRCQGLKLHPARIAHLQYFRAIANSHHAATQCAQWLRLRHATYTEKGWGAALCYDVSTWLLWLHAPLHMHRIQCLIRDEGMDPIDAQIETLGCETRLISLGLARAWQLPSLIIEALDNETSMSRDRLKKLHQRSLDDPELDKDELRAIGHLLQQHFFPVQLANWLVLTTYLGWRDQRLLELYDIVNDYLGGELAETTALIHQNCALSAQQYHVPGTLAPATEMLFLPSDTLTDQTLSARELALYAGKYPDPIPPPLPMPVAAVADPVPLAAAAPARPVTPVDTRHTTFANARAFHLISGRLQQGYSLYTRPTHILQGLLMGLSKGLGLQRLALQVVRSGNQLKTAQVIGIPDGDPLTRLDVALDSSTLLRQLCSKPACLWLNDSTRPRLGPMLPESYRAALSEHDGLLMAIFANGKPVAVVYGDLGNQTRPLAAFHRDQFRALCNAASTALDTMLHRP